MTITMNNGRLLSLACAGKEEGNGVSTRRNSGFIQPGRAGWSVQDEAFI